MLPSSSWGNMKADLQSISPMRIPLKGMKPLSKHWLYLIIATFRASWRTLKPIKDPETESDHRCRIRGWNAAKCGNNHVRPSHFLSSGFKWTTPKKTNNKKNPALPSAACSLNPREMCRRHPCHVLLWIGRKIVSRVAAVASRRVLPCSRIMRQIFTFCHVLLNLW